MKLAALLLSALLLALSAPRSGLNVISVPATSSPRERNLSGSIGAPIGVVPRSPSEAEQRDVAAESHRAGFLETPASQGWSGANVGAPLFARTGIGTAAFGGLATWYATPGFTAAAGPDLRAIRGWRGSLVKVTSRGRTVIVRLTDACACGDRGGRPTLLDLSNLAFQRLSPLSAGVIRVTVEIGGRLPTLPATDTVP